MQRWPGITGKVGRSLRPAGLGGGHGPRGAQWPPRRAVLVPPPRGGPRRRSLARPTGRVPPDAMERTAATALGPRALRACATSAPVPRSNLEAITPATTAALPGQALGDRRDFLGGLLPPWRQSSASALPRVHRPAPATLT